MMLYLKVWVVERVGNAIPIHLINHYVVDSAAYLVNVFPLNIDDLS